MSLCVRRPVLGTAVNESLSDNIDSQLFKGDPERWERYVCVVGCVGVQPATKLHAVTFRVTDILIVCSVRAPDVCSTEHTAVPAEQSWSFPRELQMFVALNIQQNLLNSRHLHTSFS